MGTSPLPHQHIERARDYRLYSKDISFMIAVFFICYILEYLSYANGMEFIFDSHSFCCFSVI